MTMLASLLRVTTRSMATKPSIANIKELRKITQLPMKLCKQALEESDDSVKSAIDWLRNNEEARAQMAKGKLADRPVGEGRIAILSLPSSVSMIQVNCETDFVARNDGFTTLLSDIGSACAGFFGAQSQSTVFSMLNDEASGDIPMDGKTVAQVVNASITGFGENVKFTRSCGLSFDAATTVVGSYTHLNGTYAALVSLSMQEGSTHADKVQALADMIAKNVVAVDPLSTVDDASVDNEAVNENVDVLLAQDLVFEPGTTVAKKIEAVSEEAGTPIRLNAWVRWAK